MVLDQVFVETHVFLLDEDNVITLHAILLQYPSVTYSLNIFTIKALQLASQRLNWSKGVGYSREDSISREDPAEAICGLDGVLWLIWLLNFWCTSYTDLNVAG